MTVDAQASIRLVFAGELLKEDVKEEDVQRRLVEQDCMPLAN